MKGYGAFKSPPPGQGKGGGCRQTRSNRYAMVPTGGGRARKGLPTRRPALHGCYPVETGDCVT